MNKNTCLCAPYMNHNSYHVFFTNLANSLKIGIILELRKGDKNVTELTNELGVEQSKISHALASMRCCSIVQSRQKGKERIYSLNKDTIVPMLKLIDRHANKHCKCTNCGKLKCMERMG